jgi:hypothetical protein
MFHPKQEMRSFVGSRKETLFAQLSTSIEQRFSQVDGEIATEVKKYVADPLGFVMYAFDWVNDEALHIVELQEPWRSRYDQKWGPEAWACQLFDDIGRQVKEHAFDGRIPVRPIREAVSSGHGIGKTATIAQLVNWIMSTRPRSKGTVTAGSYRQLEVKTWPEVIKWARRSVTADWFEMSVSGLWLKSKTEPDGWRCDAISCAKENSGSFQGQHSIDSTSFYFFDEAASVPHEIWDAASGGLTDGEPMMFAFGNPISNTGDFRDCFAGRARALWNTRQIDSRKCSIPNKEYIKELVDAYGEDSDYVKIRVRGEFPSAGSNQFIPSDAISKAAGKINEKSSYDFAPRVLGVDVARFGDDQTVFTLRQGVQVLGVWKFRGKDTMWTAGEACRLIDEYGCNASFVDDIGVGGGVTDRMRQLGYKPIAVNAGSASPSEEYSNMRAHMWGKLKEWLIAGGGIPDDGDLKADLAGPEYGFDIKQRIQLEKKTDMKKRGLASPDSADSLALTFAYPVRTKDPYEMVGDSWPKRPYDPLRNWDVGYDPLRNF